uniref:hepatoma-derived growth factor-related protein 3 isoform X3 n=1 Tax=Panthera onca TaxID=9690 RepID=UPI0029557A75|nr:hepatoma-derived growth factor-related protein 3 isoform X3 [Panthera onca]
MMARPPPPPSRPHPPRPGARRPAPRAGRGRGRRRGRRCARRTCPGRRRGFRAAPAPREGGHPSAHFRRRLRPGQARRGGLGARAAGRRAWAAGIAAGRVAGGKPGPGRTSGHVGERNANGWRRAGGGRAAGDPGKGPWPSRGQREPLGSRSSIPRRILRHPDLLSLPCARFRVPRGPHHCPGGLLGGSVG